MKRTGASRALARRYANALFSVAIDKKAPLERIASELQELSDLLEKESRLAEALASPAITSSKRVKVLEEVLAGQSLTDVTLNTLRLLTGKDRISILPDVAAQYKNLLMEHDKIESGEVVSAHPLSTEQQGKLASKLGQTLGKTMQLSYRTDPELVGGLVVRIGNRVYDACVASELRRFKEKTLAGL